jgi:hypothetical protein
MGYIDAIALRARAIELGAGTYASYLQTLVEEVTSLHPDPGRT